MKKGFEVMEDVMRLKIMNSDFEINCRIVLDGLEVLGKEAASRGYGLRQVLWLLCELEV